MKKKIIVILLMAALIAAVTQLSSAEAEESPQVAFSNAAYCDNAVTMTVTASGLQPLKGYSLEDEAETWFSALPGGLSPTADESGNFNGPVRLMPEEEGITAPTSLPVRIYLDDPSADGNWSSDYITVSVADCNPPPESTTTVPPTVTTTTAPPPESTTTVPPTVTTIAVIPSVPPTAPTTVPPQAPKKSAKKVLLTTS